MKHKTIQTNKAYEEKLNDELCNFNPQSLNSSDFPESVRTKETMENTANLSHTNYTNSLNKETIFNVSTRTKATNNNNNNSNLNKSSSRERKKTSRKSYRNSFHNSALNLEPLPTQSPLISLVASLKDKIEFYENECKSLIDEKIQMQMTINNLQMQQMRKSTTNSRNSGRSKDITVNNINKSALLSENNKVLRISHESVFELQNNSRNEEKFGSDNVNNLLSGMNNNNINNNNNSKNDNGKNKNLNVDYNCNNNNGNNNNRSFNDVNTRKNSNANRVSNNNNLGSFDKDSFLNNHHQDNLSRQKKLLETNNYILEDTINVQNIKDFGKQHHPKIFCFFLFIILI
jgi:hypothetical protein